jgi:hypothetical protein
MLFTNAFRAQMALTSVIEAFWGCMSDGGSILLSTKGDLDPPSLNFYFEGEPGEKVLKKAAAASSEWREFEELASILDIRYEWQEPGGGFVLFFCGAPAQGQTALSK